MWEDWSAMARSDGTSVIEEQRSAGIGFPLQGLVPMGVGGRVEARLDGWGGLSMRGMQR